jgi:SpoVK/Ycf46/Vps4 family AAA+-type ATPase
MAGRFIEINAHSLFSKYYSESGKLVLSLFQNLNQVLDNERMFVCILIDEVESLSGCRKAALSGNEPSDSIRVVNALLTQIDQLKTRQNVLIMTTSNVSDAIDEAFVDRADLVEYIGYPSSKAAYAILSSALRELMKSGLVHPTANMYFL